MSRRFIHLLEFMEDYMENASFTSSSILPPCLSVPSLSKEDLYHAFISYCNRDSIWVHGLIYRIGETLPNLRISYHQKDFLPGKTIIDNMIACIQKSQKILIVLSPDFVRSRWCLFEANLSLFQDCLGHKAVVPIMLKPCKVPLFLSHFTYLDAEDEHFFEKLTQILSNEKKTEDEDVKFHYQPTLLYQGKPLLTLSAVNENDTRYKNPFFPEAVVPDALKAIMEDSEEYKKAIQVINNAPMCHHVFDVTIHRLTYAGSISVTLTVALMLSVFCFFSEHWKCFLGLPLSVIPPVILGYREEMRVKNKPHEIPEVLIKNTGIANLILMKQSVLAGCFSISNISFVYVSLKKCMKTFEDAFGCESDLANAMQEKAIIQYSSDYACCLARKHFPISDGTPPSHIKDGTCFCQYVAARIKYDCS